ncbi:putative pigment precursor permease, P-loop containing nucleoside triphosphate hydrolase [Medicago truncatula]|uniref:Putative pigment permease, P-loop containing nucleoside triphosphate hydrolase n=1 Tax=Medicago truncatula TaxID=3880 RepID=G7JHT4_MEDTR|nr:ABC transporter G family member 23 [Medicago truncatula]AES91713.1 white-brown-complex ABC transporter family protein [Medicago truncatula]RHN64077.1 putative pigment precursor permease, P-loop containing nucleoside triphosphate hydrolase [Medicago truncatula]
MASCLKPQSSNEDDSVILFSTSNSSISPSSSSFHHSPPPTSYKLSINNLTYTLHPYKTIPFSFKSLTQKPHPVNILKSVSFVARTSEIVAVVGPSGTGKSTLLRIIAGRIKDKDFNPKTISINDHPMSTPSQLRKICGFVSQEDNLLPLLTVKETLLFGAKFRLKEMTPKERELRVENLMQELGLFHVAHSFVGDDENRGVSGGERKRVSIGVDMIHNPPILVLDEPTSGLDSTSALHVIELLSSMVKSKQRIVILSIHQPSYRILQYISKFLILSHGSVVHNGSLESLEERISNLGFQIPLQLNALEFSMEIIQSLEDNSSSFIVHENETSFPSSMWAPEEENIGSDVFQSQYEKENFGHLCYVNMMEILFLCSRFWKIIYRTKQLFLARTMQALVGGFGLASVYIKVRKDEDGIAERLGLFAFSLSFLLSSTVEALPIYLQERTVLMKEASRGAYRISSYLIANTFVFLPFLFVVSLLFAVPVYWIVGLNPSLTAFTFFTFVVWLIVLMASSLVLFLSSVSPDFISGNSLICTVLGAFFLFSGYFIPKESIPKYWLFMYYVSLYRYPLDALLTNEYWNVGNECFSQGSSSMCLVTGFDVLKSRGIEKDNRWMNVGIMFGFFVFYRLLCWVILARKASKTTI